MNSESEAMSVRAAFGLFEVASNLTIASRSLMAAYKVLHAETAISLDHRSIYLDLTALDTVSGKELRGRAYRVINTAWQRVFTEIPQDKAKRPYSDVKSHQNYYTALVLQVLKDQAIIEKIDLAFVLEYLRQTVYHLPRSIAAVIKKSGNQSCPPGLYLMVTLLVALVRAKTKKLHGSAILSAKPLAIPLTVQPCAP